MKNKRYYTVLKITFFFIGLLLIRTFKIQIFDGPSLSEAAYSQRLVNLQLEKMRGNILDRNEIPFTNREEKVQVIIKPAYLRGQYEDIDKLCNTLNIDSYIFQKEMEFKSEPVLFETDKDTAQKVKSLGIQGVTLLHSLKRYTEPVASHVIGYLRKSDQIGETGIEKFFEEVLKYNDENSVAVITDAKSNPVQGLGYRIFSADKNSKMLHVKTTLDYHIQKIVSDVLDKYGIKGAAVVIEVNTGDIVAMVSKPDFDQNNVDRYLNSSNNELFNRAVASYSPGSIFKIIDAAVFYESGGVMQEYYNCEGYIRLGNISFKCHSFDQGGHGWINLQDAFAFSCNAYFINMGLKLKPLNIINMAGKFGFGEETGIYKQGVEESCGNLPEIGKFYSDGDVANISIGQGDILATPLQVAAMTATIANGGIKNRINIVDSVVDSQGNKVRNLRIDEGTRVISKRTADKVRRLMEQTTRNGTGILANVDEYGGAGGKTGSAETGQVVNGEKVIHAWFTGYFPIAGPRYAVSIFVENGKSGGEAAAPIFADIAREILIKGY
ncbi:MAG TPA: peptidoglycan glycosyltransferase [Clostridiaceae bacterium]|nr:peptidoglycan glycosyltransferase [Clostridiaceae bacterium]